MALQNRQKLTSHSEEKEPKVDWFAKNASAIQAIASVVGMLVTTVLAGITYWYVRVTREIAKSSAAQVQQMKEAAQTVQKRSVRTLGSLVSRLRNSLGQLSPDAPIHNQLRVFNEFNEGDITRLEAFVSQIDNGTILAASGTATLAMREIFATIQECKRIPPEMGIQFSNAQIQSWIRARQDSDRSLHEIENECERLLVQ